MASKTKRVAWTLLHDEKKVASGVNPYGLHKFLNSYILDEYDWTKQIENVSYTMNSNGTPQYYLLRGHGLVRITKKMVLTFAVIDNTDPRFDLPFDDSIQRAIEKHLSK